MKTDLKHNSPGRRLISEISTVDLDTGSSPVIESRLDGHGGQMESNSTTPTLFDVIKQFHEIKVDDYQRTYAWQNDQIDELFEDLKECTQTGENHFFGTLIFESRDGVHAKIVDGQQRLTTVFVLVATLRDQLQKLSLQQIEPAKPGQLPIYVTQKAWSILVPGQDMNEHRFRSNRFLSEIFANGVMPLPEHQIKINDRQSAISLAFRKGIKRVRSLIEADLQIFSDDASKLQRINSLLDSLMNRFLVLKVVTGNVSESLDIFLTLNNRGLPLGASDLVRGIIMGYVSHDEPEKEQYKIHRRIFEEWKNIADQVRDPEVFLRHYLVSTGKEKVQKKRVFETVQGRIKVDNPSLRKQKADEFWGLLLQAAEIYGKIINPKMGGDLQLYLEMLEGLIKSHRVLLLTAMQILNKEEEITEIARLAMVLGYRWVMNGGNAQMLENFFQDQSAALHDGFSADSVMGELRAKANFKLDVGEYLRQEGDSSFISRALLYAVNARLAPHANQIPLDGTVHLEHIAPQTETEEWKSSLFGSDTARFSEYERWTSEIGNLTLLDFKINLKVQQKLFETKKLKYEDSLLKISRELSQLDKWTITEIEARTTWLTECFESIWSIEKNAQRVISFPEWLATRNESLEASS